MIYTHTRALFRRTRAWLSPGWSSFRSPSAPMYRTFKAWRGPMSLGAPQTGWDHVTRKRRGSVFLRADGSGLGLQGSAGLLLKTSPPRRNSLEPIAPGLDLRAPGCPRCRHCPKHPSRGFQVFNDAKPGPGWTWIGEQYATPAWLLLRTQMLGSLSGFTEATIYFG